MSPEVAALLGSGISGLVAGGLALFGGYQWGRARSDAAHATRRAEAWKQVSEGVQPIPPPPPPPRDPTQPYTEEEIQSLIDAAHRLSGEGL